MVDIKNFKWSDKNIELDVNETNCNEILFELLGPELYFTFDKDDVVAMAEYFGCQLTKKAHSDSPKWRGVVFDKETGLFKDPETGQIIDCSENGNVDKVKWTARVK